MTLIMSPCPYLQDIIQELLVRFNHNFFKRQYLELSAPPAPLDVFISSLNLLFSSVKILYSRSNLLLLLVRFSCKILFLACSLLRLSWHALQRHQLKKNNFFWWKKLGLEKRGVLYPHKLRVNFVFANFTKKLGFGRDPALPCWDNIPSLAKDDFLRLPTCQQLLLSSSSSVFFLSYAQNVIFYIQSNQSEPSCSILGGGGG